MCKLRNNFDRIIHCYRKPHQTVHSIHISICGKECCVSNLGYRVRCFQIMYTRVNYAPLNVRSRLRDVAQGAFRLMWVTQYYYNFKRLNINSGINFTISIIYRQKNGIYTTSFPAIIAWAIDFPTVLAVANRAFLGTW